MVYASALRAPPRRLRDEGELNAVAVGGVVAVLRRLAVQMPAIPADSLRRNRGGDLHVVVISFGRSGGSWRRDRRPDHGERERGLFFVITWLLPPLAESPRWFPAQMTVDEIF